MSICSYSPPNFEHRSDLIKTLSIEHKTFDCDKLVVETSFKGIAFKLEFRNSYKHKLLTAIVYKDGFNVVINHHKKGYITGHDFILFVNRICNNIEGI